MPELVLLHGWGMHRGIWQPLLADYAQYFQVRALDLPGYGDNSEQHVDSVEEMVDVIAEQIQEPCALLGWSLGGMVAMQLAARYPQKVERLMTVASSPRFCQQDDWPGVDATLFAQFADDIFACEERSVSRHGERSEAIHTTLKNFINLQCVNLKNAATLRRQLWQILLQKPLPSTKTLQTGLHILQDSDCRDALSLIQCPSMHLYGGIDSIVPASVCQAMAQRQPQHQTVLIPGAGHTPFLSHAPEFLSQLMRWQEL